MEYGSCEQWTSTPFSMEMEVLTLVRAMNTAEDQYHCYNRMRWYVKKVRYCNVPYPHAFLPIQGEEFDDMKTVDFPFYRPIGIHSQFKFEVELWAYADCDDCQEGPPFKDIGMYKY